MSETVELPVSNHHVDKSFMADWMAVRANGEIVVVDHAGESLTTYTLGTVTQNPRVLANASATFWQGGVRKAEFMNGIIHLSHTYAGTTDRLLPDEFFEHPTMTLERTQLVRLKGEL